MIKNKKAYLVVFFAFMILGFALGSLTRRVMTSEAVPAEAIERTDGVYYSLVDDKGQVRLITALQVFQGDRYLDEDNRLYEVEKLDASTGTLKFLRQVDLERELSGEVIIPADLALFTGPVAQEDIKPETPKGKIGVYHSHAQESYIPTEKKENVAPKGGIVKVGESFSKGLQKSGVDVIHSEVPHGKSDSGAYRRSRRTALRIMQKGIDALIDIHRDAVPPEPYREEVKGKEIAKVLLVIGGQNQHRDANTRFAGGLKRVADKTYPGLVRGVYWGRGNYNQDLSPRALLMEMGSTTNERIRAERGAELMGEVTADFLYEGKPGAGPGLVGGDRTPDEPRSAARTIAALLGLLAAGVIGFLVISTGGVKEAVAKLKQFRRTEFANFLGRARERVRTGRRKNKRD